MLIVGDIGGTNARLQLLSPQGKLVRQEKFVSHDYGSLEEVLRHFLSGADDAGSSSGDSSGGSSGRASRGSSRRSSARAGKSAKAKPKPPKVTAAAFGIAGPVVNGRCTATNLPWVVDERVVSRKLGIRKVTLLNDLVALALGAMDVKPSRRKVLGEAGAPRKKGANVAVIAAGTGLGEAVLAWDGARYVPMATEGGHADFAPRDAVEIEILRFLIQRHGHVSYERLVSGMGIGNLYEFFRDVQHMGETSANEEALAKGADRNAVIGQLGVEGRSKPAAAAVERLAMIYGAEAGNLALKSMALGGVLVCGNIAGKLLPAFEKGAFLRGFRDKGRFATLMANVPVAVVLDTDVGLAGSKRVVLGEV